jgi:translation initiation factor 1 (eIF-1/SUI1)
MDFFNINDNDIMKVEKEYKIYIWTRKPKKTINTCMSGWDIDIKELKEIHKNMKKKLGCSGTLKKEEIFDFDNKQLVFTLSCNCISEIKSMLLSNGINEKNIIIKV